MVISKDGERMQDTRNESGGKIAVFIDIQNMNADTQFDALFSKLEATGKVEVKMAYAEWKDVGVTIRKNMLRHHVKQIQTSHLASSGKNGADMQIVIDVMNALNEKEDINTFVIAAGDTDYVPLINEIASRGKRCIVAAHDEKVGEAVKECCHEFISLDEIAINYKKELVAQKTMKTQPVESKQPAQINVKGSESPVTPLVPVKKSAKSVLTLATPEPKKEDTRENEMVKQKFVRKRTRGGGVTIENDKKKSLTLFPDQWLMVLDAMQICCNYGPVDFGDLLDYIENLIDKDEVTFSKNIVVPVINTFVKQGLFTQPVRGRIVISDNFDRKRKEFVHEYQLE